MKAKSQKARYVLVMEDNPAHAELIMEILDRHFSPVVIHTVDTIKAGLEFLKKTRYDLIMTDSFVSEESINKHIKKIRSNFKKTPVIIITGRGDETLAAELARQGVSEYLVKTKETLDALHQILERYL